VKGHRRYRAPSEDAFARLMQWHSVAGFHVEPMPPIEVCDRYLDTAHGALLREGIVLRLRSKEGGVLASLRFLERASDGELAQASYEDGLERDGVNLPEGAFRSAVEQRTGGAALEVLLSFRQYRTSRALYAGDRLAGWLSLAVVADETDPRRPAISNEVEIDLVTTGTPDDLQRLDHELTQAGFRPDTYSKFERAFLRRARRDRNRLLLLPQERSALTEYVESEAAVERRRAEAILLAADGQDGSAISRRVGLAPSRVRHWREAFRTDRMRIFDSAARDPRIIEAEDAQPRFTVSELVSDPMALSRARRAASRSHEVDYLFARLRHGDIAAGAASAVPHDTARHVRPAPEGGEDEQIHPAHAAEDENGLTHKELWVHLSFGDTQQSPMPADGERTDREAQDPPTEESAMLSARSAVPFLPVAEDVATRVRPDEPLSTLASSVLGRAAGEIARLTSGIEAELQPTGLREIFASLEWVVAVLYLFEEQGDGQPLLTTEAESLQSDILTMEILSAAIEHLADSLADHSSAESAALALVRTLWSAEQRRVLDGGEERARLSARLSSFAESLASFAASEDAPERRPAVKHVLASSLRRRYEALQALENRIDSEELDLLELRAHLSVLEHQFALLDAAHAREPQQAIAQACRAVLSYIYESERAQRLAVCRDWLSAGGTANASLLDKSRNEAEVAAEVARQQLVIACGTLFTEDFRNQLAGARDAL
jgi:hypothetical protein